jgi:hypothetical protein
MGGAVDEQKVLQQLKDAYTIPTGRMIFDDALAAALGNRVDDIDWIKKNFSGLVENVQSRAYELYLAAERPAAAAAFRKVFGDLLPAGAQPKDVFDAVENNFWALDKFFLGLTQGRRPRAGKAFENVIKALFDKLEYPYTPQPVINGQPDFLLPSKEHYDKNAMDCVIFTVKRTLRERWRQIISEGTRGHSFYLATIDIKVAKRDLPEMLANRIYLVLPEAIRAKYYPDTVNAISFEDFFLNHLDLSMQRWRSKKVIE